MNNLEISWVFLEIADLLEIKGDNLFKIRSYRQAAQLLATLDEDIGVYWNEKRLTELPGIGPALAAKIHELLDTGHLTYLKSFARRFRPSYDSFFLFPAWVRAQYIPYTATWVLPLWKNLRQLLQLNNCACFLVWGTKSELAIKHALATMDVVPEGLPLSDAAMVAADLAEALAQLPEVTNVEVVGEVRRREEFVCEATLLLSATGQNWGGYPGHL